MVLAKTGEIAETDQIWMVSFNFSQHQLKLTI